MKELKKGNWWAKGKEKLFKQCEKSKHQYYLKKIILGINTKDNQEITKIYQKNGISHIFAISGMHFYMIYHIVYYTYYHSYFLSLAIKKTKKLIYLFTIWKQQMNI